MILHAKAPFGPGPDAAAAGAHASQVGESVSLQEFAQRTMSCGPDQLSDGRSSSAFQRGQLDLQVCTPQPDAITAELSSMRHAFVDCVSDGAAC